MQNQTILPTGASTMEKLGYFITGAIAGIAGLVGAAFYFDENPKSASSSEETSEVKKADEAEEVTKAGEAGGADKAEETEEVNKTDEDKCRVTQQLPKSDTTTAKNLLLKNPYNEA